MSDETQTTTTENAAPAQEAPAETFSREYVQELRNEAAKYRTEKNNAVEAARAEVIKDYEAKLAQKDGSLSEMETEVSSRSLELLKLKMVLNEGIPTEDVLDVVSLVQGTDEATVSESVKRVKSLIGRKPPADRPVDPSQGQGNHLPLNGDPLLEMVKSVVGA